ncbi:MAG: FG-GAP-like repeat-containing protein [Chitinispirillia bacterium]|nr:FG-GAP-like repeat-containing protein [Chitinispirillia bacterium]
MLPVSLANAQTGSPEFRSRLFKSASAKEIVETARSHQWSLDFTKSGKDTLHVIALRVEFERDTSAMTTGDGRFGMLDTKDKEQHYYAQDTVYRFDDLPHDSLYFANQLTALSRYYGKVSRGNLTVQSTVYPSGRDAAAAYKVPHTMPYYSPGWKRKNETTDQYLRRKEFGIILFVRDAIQAAASAGANSPFRNLYRDDNGILRDAGSHRKTAVLIIHAGASDLTDGLMTGEPNTPSDMIDVFVERNFFKDYKDTLKLDSAGVTVAGNGGQNIIIDEVMMAPETANQEGVNWGIQGILVNQLARQLGVPDLFSTSDGVSAIGAFCIMDFAGYSTGQGFIPPYPSAWVRAFMGWDKPVVAGAGAVHGVKALTSVLDTNINTGTDTTILLIPINNNEYYLVENRQRNLAGDPSMFSYYGDSKRVISAYPFNINLPANVKETSNASGVILAVKNNDIGLPASGALVWHVDERVIRRRMEHNLVNADAAFRGVRLVEADGISDLGVMFRNDFYQILSDYGGAEDVFPHKKLRGSGTLTGVDGFGPYSRPSTRSNDGGHSYLNIKITTSETSPREEHTRSFQGDTVINYSSEKLLVDVKYDHLVQGWPRRAAPEKFFDPLITEFTLTSTPLSAGRDTVLTLLSKSGRLYLYSVNGSRRDSYGNRTAPVNLVDYQGKPVTSSITAAYFDSIPGVYTFPTAIGRRILIPSTHSNQHNLHIYHTIDAGDKSTLTLPSAPTSYVCGINTNTWAVGLTDGRIITGTVTNSNDTNTIRLPSGSPVNAIAVLKDTAGTFAAIQGDGTLSIIKGRDTTVSAKVLNGIPPYNLVTGDLDGDGTSELIITDNKQGVWVYTRELKLAQGWSDKPNDWASVWHIDPDNSKDRARYTVNPSAPALADINRDGSLDIVVSGTNGIYALNRRGALLSRWPAYLDGRYWYQRGTVTTSPIVVSADRNQPLVLFSSPTGERATFSIVKIVSADKKTGIITFPGEDGRLDSLWGYPQSFIDSLVTVLDSLILPYILPGGFVDALSADAARPHEKIGSWAIQQSRWPLSAGAPVTTSPVVYRTTPNSVPDLFAVASDGMVYRWKLNGIISDSLYWPQTGFDAARSFAYGGPLTKSDEIITQKQPIIFWNYPNPTQKSVLHTTFKYQFSGPATNVRLDIQTITGKRMDTFKNLSGSFPDWNEFNVDLRKYGPGIYRCRMEAVIGKKKHVKMWKMAVVK